MHTDTPEAPSRPISMVDLHAEVASIRPELDAALGEILDTTAFVRGPVVSRFETALADYLREHDERQPDVHVIGVANGTDALQIALMALGVGPGDEVICPAFTFVATAEAAALLGATPVFCDIDPATYNLSPEALNAAITPRTRAVVPVHLFGQMADMAAIRAVCEPRGIAIVEDAAQAIGATRDGRAAGLVGDIGTLSFYPSKNLGAYGDGGAVYTTSEPLAVACRQIANHGSARKYHHTRVGINSRLDAMQAAILNVKLPHLPAWTDARRAVAALYDAHLGGHPEIEIPARASGARHVFHQYTVRVPAERRDAIASGLRERGIPTMIYYPEGLHLMPPYASGAALAETERACREVLSLPMHPHLSSQEVGFIARALQETVADPVAA